MSQREALIEGAKRCLLEKGYSGTTARDIAAAARANLGSISYYFGSKDRLMNLAAIELSGEWGDTLEAAARAAGGDTRAERLGALLTALLEMIPRAGDTQSASLLALTQSKFDDELRAEIAAGHTRARTALAAIVLGAPPTERDAQGLGALVYALVTGLVAQTIVDPGSLPDPGLLAEALGSIVDE